MIFSKMKRELNKQVRRIKQQKEYLDNARLSMKIIHLYRYESLNKKQISKKLNVPIERVERILGIYQVEISA